MREPIACYYFDRPRDTQSKMQFDEILSYLGTFGPYQRRVFFLLCLINIPRAMHNLAQVFLGGSTEHWCSSPELDLVNCTNWNLDEKQCIQAKRDASIPPNPDPKSSTFPYESCERYNLTGIPYLHVGMNTTEYTNQTLPCDAGWNYDDSQYQSTIITDFNLVCDKEGLSNVAQSIYFSGNFVGSIIFGVLADRIGRSPCMLIALVLWFGSAMGTAFAPDIYTYMALRFFVACGSEGTFIPAYIIGTEFVGPSARTITGIFPQFTFAFGVMLQAALAFFFRDWRIFQLVMAIPLVLFFLYVPFLAESARWLITSGQHKKAEKIIRRVAKVNNKELPDVLFEPGEINAKEEKQKGDQASCFVLFTRPNMAFKTVNLMWNWCVSSMVFYAITLYTPNLGLNAYLSFFIAGLVEIPAYIYATWACQHFGGRRLNMACTSLVLGVACLITGFLEPGVAVTCVAMVGKFTASAAYSIVYIFSAELFPTPVRSAGMGLSFAASRIGCIVGPLLFLAGNTWKPLPFVIFGPCAISAGLLTLMLPETRGRNLPETLEEGEEFGKPKWMTRSREDAGHESKTENGKVNMAYTEEINSV